MQEATLVLGMLLQRYRFVDAHDYDFKVKETLTIKPDNFKIHLRQRTDEDHQTVAKSAEPVKQPAQPAPVATLRAEPRVDVWASG